MRNAITIGQIVSTTRNPPIKLIKKCIDCGATATVQPAQLAPTCNCEAA